MKNIRTIILALPLLVACEAQEAVAPRSNAIADPLRSYAYPTEAFLLNNNKIFFWPESRTPEQVTEVLAQAKNVDRAEEDRDRLKPRYDEVESRYKPLKSRLDSMGRGITRIQIAIDGLERQLAQEEGRGGDADQERIRQLKEQIEAKKSEKTEATRLRDEFAASCTHVFAEFAAVTNDANAISARGEAAVNAIAKVAEWYKAHPTAIVISPLDEAECERSRADSDWSCATPGQRQFDVAISGWKLCFEDRVLGTAGPGFPEYGESCETDPYDFSTAAGTIINTKYTPAGGIYEFDVLVNANVTYHLKLIRNRYSEEDESRSRGESKMYFGGDIKRTIVHADGTRVIREGSIKLSQGNNTQ